MKIKMRNFGMMLMAVVALTLTFSNTTLANGEKNPKSSSIELKFIGHYENQPVFLLNLNNTEEDEFSITFRDDYGNVLYSGKVKGSNISKKFMLNTEEIGDNVLNVEVKAKKNDKSEIYQINRNRSYVDETVVNKVK
ncbi:hypothetical protein D3H65_28885 [Paraflavitalea soli]|uniref:DUF3244 domain-containing protein n=1 Tax=Paraflavitalea soli TaxID=2315862 RepID=A0A3B7MT75_9BACT|nr:hypothetical protein [Paraflavitalea soli]AXY77754.1 hypothetical protein D3H65_28885 [Paraflavitalea soli]